MSLPRASDSLPPAPVPVLFLDSPLSSIDVDSEPPSPSDLPDSETFMQPASLDGDSREAVDLGGESGTTAEVDGESRTTAELDGQSSVTTLAPWSQTSEATRFTEYRFVDENTQASSSSEDNVAMSSGLRIEDNGDSIGSNAEPVNEVRLAHEEIKECNEPPAKIRKISSPKNPKSDEPDGETCPICLDSWANSGEHRLVALKCGHLFGSQCVERWLRAQPAKDRSCPTCKSKANVKDLRFIYARRLVVADTSQITALQKQNEVLLAEKSRTELELQRSNIKLRSCAMQLEVLRTLMKSQENKEQPVRRTWRFALEKNLEICKEGGCRVLTYNCRTYELYVSQKSGNYLFPGYGIRKVNCLDYKLGQFVHLHQKPIRDIIYSQPRDLLLSVGLDNSARIVERGIPSVTVNTGMPLWSCSWDYLRSNDFYVGGVGGVIRQYDVRNSNNYIRMLSAPGDMSPVVSLRSTEFGLLSCQLNSCWLWIVNNGMWEPRPLPVGGSYMSLCYDNDTHRVLISGRPTPSGPGRSKLSLCKLKASVPSGEILFDIEETFNGSTRVSQMSRASWVKVPGASWVAAHSESDSTLYLHGLDGSRTMSLPAAEPALDVGCAELNGNAIVAALSESRLRIYKAVPTNT